MTSMNKPVTFTIFRTIAVAVIGVASLGVFTSTARADHDRKNIQDPVVIVNRGHHDNLPIMELGRGRGHHHGRDCSCNSCHPSQNWAQREYDTGVKAGRCEGFDECYADGLKGRRFDDCVSKDLSCVSEPFRDGYHWAFSRAYARGFEQGQCERPCERPIRGGGWSWRIRW